MTSPPRPWRKVEENAETGESILGQLAFRIFGIVCIFGAIILAAKLFPDAPTEKAAVAACIGAVVAALVYHVFEKARGAPGLIDFKERSHRMIAIGLGLALAFSVLLLMYQIQSERYTETVRDASRREQEAYSEMMRSPEMQKAAEMMRRIRELRDRRASGASTTPATKPAATDEP